MMRIVRQRDITKPRGRDLLAKDNVGGVAPDLHADVLAEAFGAVEERFEELHGGGVLEGRAAAVLREVLRSLRYSRWRVSAGENATPLFQPMLYGVSWGGSARERETEVLTARRP